MNYSWQSLECGWNCYISVISEVVYYTAKLNPTVIVIKPGLGELPNVTADNFPQTYVWYHKPL